MSDLPSPYRTVTGSVVELPAETPCGLCAGGEVPGGCPQCDGAGVNPFVPLPVCGEGCRFTTIAIAGYHRDGKEELPVYECSNGHYTAIRYVKTEVTDG